jgi:outer membrane protein, multidrug efflux system
MNLSVRLSNSKLAKHVIARVIACSMLLLVLPSCGIPNLRPAKLGPDVPEKFTVGYNGATGSENISQIPIENFFNDPKLTSLICQALAGGNQQLRILNEDIQIASNEVWGASGAYLPFVTVGGVAGVDRSSRFTPLGAAEDQLEYLPGKHFPGLPGNFVAAANISWQVDIWRQLRNARDAAKLRFLATAEGRNYYITRLVAEIAQNYYMLMALDKRLENLDQIIALQERSLAAARALMQGARGTELGVQRFLAEVRSNQSQKLIVKQDIIEVENRINFLAGRYPQPVDRTSVRFFDLNIQTLGIGTSAQLLQNRPDIRQAERELAAAGLDVKVARARFFPRLDIMGPGGYQAFNPRYLFWTPDALFVSIAGNLVTPLINKRAIQADYKTANAKQLQAVYNYQRVILNAYTEVVNHVFKVQNYSNSIEIKKQQVESLSRSVNIAGQLFQRAFAPAEDPGRRANYMDVLFAQRDLFDARMILIETKQQQLSAIVDVYQALGGGLLGCHGADPKLSQPGPSLAQSQQGRSDRYGTEQLPAPGNQPAELPAPRKQPDQLPAPGKQPEQLPGPNAAQDGPLLEPRKLPTYLPPQAATVQ